MPSKKKKYNARFPPARIKKIMQSDEEVGKVAQAVPVIISRALELFVESLLKKAAEVTHARNAKTLTPSHLKQCIMMETRFDFLKELVSTVSDVQGDDESAAIEPSTPRTASGGNDTAFSFQPQQQRAGQNNPGRSSAGTSASSTSVRNEDHQPAPSTQQHQIPSYAAGIPEYLSLQNSSLPQGYVKQENIGNNQGENALYMPSTSTPVRGPPPPGMAGGGSHHMQQQMYHSMQPQPQMVIHQNPQEYVLSHAQQGNYQQQEEQARHFFYSQYDHSNGQARQVKTENQDNQRGYGNQGSYDYNRSYQY